MDGGGAIFGEACFDEAAFQRLRASLRQKLNQDACDYWASIRHGRQVPLRRDLDPTEIPRLLPSVILIEVLRPGPDFRYRLIGTRWVEHFGRDYTGTLMSELEHQRPPSSVWKAVQAVVDSRMPMAPRLPYAGRLFRDRNIEVLISPLSRTGEEVDFLFVTVDFAG